MPGPVVLDTSRLPVVRARMVDADGGNPLTESMVAALVDALDQAERTPGAEIVVLDAIGDTFCAGLPLSDVDSGRWRGWVVLVHDLFTRLTSSPLATIALVDGAALGGGVGLAAACDLVLAGPHGSFRLTEVLLGLIPALVLPLVARRIGPQRAVSLAMTARPLACADALRLGLVDQLATEPERELRQLVRALRGTNHTAVRALKRYGNELTGPVLPPPSRVLELLAERISDPTTSGRINALREQGLLG
ncbi:MAG TPA: enoyl-CoA hydratase-related protein [Pseudonocardiaceae bacterium]|jgi:polyketide biosynthesis enoyl-CoA hydratase PksH